MTRKSDASADPYLETHIKHITDEALFAALKTSLPELRTVHAAARRGDWTAAGTAWHEHMKARLTQPHSDLRRERQRPDYDVDRLFAEAELIVKRDIKCWGGVHIQYDGEIDFTRDLGGSANHGFHYFGWLLPLRDAYEASRREIYARTFVEIFQQWYRQRDAVPVLPGRMDIIWYELGCNRARVFRDLYFVTIGSQAANNPEYHRMMLKTILGHGRWLHRHQQAYCPGNFQVYGAQTLSVLGQGFCEFKEARRWLQRGVRWTMAHARRDVHADGCHKERAPHYHLGVIDSFHDVHRVLAGSDTFATQREQLGQTLEKMLIWTLNLSTPSGHSPPINDSEYDVPQKPYLTIGLNRRNPLLVWASQATPREIAQVAQKLGIKKPVAPRPPRHTSSHQKTSRFWVVRSGWSPGDFYFALNHGPHAGGHSHDEALAFQLWARGQPLAVDCGRGISYEDPLHKPWFCSAAAHNMVAVDRQPPAVAGRQGRLRFWQNKGPVDFAAFTHHGYAHLGVSHQRTFLLNRERQYAVVLDSLTSHTDHTYTWSLNSPRKLRARPDGAIAPGFRVLTSHAEELTDARTSTVKMILPLKGRSSWGAERATGTNLQLIKSASSTEFAVLLAPTAKPSQVQFDVQPAHPRSRHQLIVTVTIDRQQDRYALDCRNGKINRRTGLAVR